MWTTWPVCGVSGRRWSCGTTTTSEGGGRGAVDKGGQGGEGRRGGVGLRLLRSVGACAAMPTAQWLPRAPCTRLAPWTSHLRKPPCHPCPVLPTRFTACSASPTKLAFHPNTHPPGQPLRAHPPPPPPRARRALDLMRTATAKPSRPRQLSQEEERQLPVQERLYRSAANPPAHPFCWLPLAPAPVPHRG
jgi:hypothetical protein